VLWRDFKRGAAATVVGCAVWAIVEYAATIIASNGPVGFGTALRFAMLDVALVALAAVVLAPLVGAACAAARLIYAAADRDAARTWPGLFAPGAGSPRMAAWMWALVFAGAVYAAGSAYLTYRFTTRYQAPDVVAVVLAWFQLGLIAVAALVAVVLARAVAALGRKLDASAGRFNPLARVVPALAAAAVLAAAGLEVVLAILPHARPLVPTRHLLAMLAIGAGIYLACWLIARTGTILPAARRPRRIALGTCAAILVLIVPITLWKVGADPHAKFLAVASSPPLRTMIDTVRKANDFDGDGYGSLLGENDCGPFDAAIHPGARDVPDNGVDENCNGSDFSLANAPSYQKGERVPVPESFRRDWNVLLITVDTLRYDHTGFGGYIEKRQRNTTPNLDQLVKKSISFSFCNAPSAGTMASIPAIQTSKFFHSGIALSGERRPKPPKILDDNLMFAEVMKRGEYKTGAILSHEYFEDWGIEQGFDSYDNSIGATRDPKRITSHELTDKTVSWVARHSSDKWFLWVHYIDPHGHYMPHPGETQFGTSEEDLYDGEIAYTDKHLGRLFDELSRMPGADRTIIVITSDHGDGFKEHGHINHGFYLNREVLHVPLIFYIPDAEPRVVDGAVSPLDVLPTVADLAGIDVPDVSFEGESLIGALFYGKTDMERVVFAETNAGGVQRAAVTAKYKLISKLQSNVNQLFDLEADPWEKKNIWQKDKAGSDLMKRYLEDWLDRVFFSRDVKTNQAAQKRAWHIVTGKPSPQVTLVAPVMFDSGALELFGYDLNTDSIEAGKKLAVKPYFRVKRVPSGDFKLQAEAWQPSEGAAKVRPARGSASFTAEGMLPTSRWREGEIVRDSLKVRIPANWTGESFFIGVRMLGKSGAAVPVSGATRPGDDKVGVVGTVGLRPAPKPPAAPPPNKTERTPPPKKAGRTIDRLRAPPR
jgi:arylsulfatase A-like enzyme